MSELFIDRIPNKHYDHVVLLSGGLDSYLTFQKAKDTGGEVLAVSFMYNQKHSIETMVSRAISREWMTDHAIFNIKMDAFWESASILKSSEEEVPKGAYPVSGTISTYVPHRNLIFLTLSSVVAKRVQSYAIWAGMHQGDHPNYPDCTIFFTNSAEQALSCSLGEVVRLHVPLMHINKSEIVKELVERNVSGAVWDFRKTVSCYNAAHNVYSEMDKKVMEYSVTQCQMCPTCMERQHAMNKNSVYETPVFSFKVKKEEIARIRGYTGFHDVDKFYEE